MGVGSLSIMWVPSSNSGHQACEEASLPTVLIIFKTDSGGWRNSSVIKTIGCSSRRPRLNSPTHVVAHNQL